MLEILYQDKDLVAINKPSGLLVHRSMIDKHETVFAMQLLRDQLGQHVYPLHRLDKPTSGVLLFGLNENIAKVMGEVFAKHEVQKTYLCVVRGFTKESEHINYALKRVFDKMTDKKANKELEAEEAITNYTRLATVELDIPVKPYPKSRYSLLQVEPKTGRKHQIRRHLKHVFHPLVGDTKYGRGEHNQMYRKHFDVHRLLLHAHKMQFQHPLTKEEVIITAPLDTCMQTLFKHFSWQEHL